MVIRNAYWCALSFAIAIVASGCIEQQVLFPVAGTVLIDGQPLPMGSIQFVPESGRPFASKIRPDGTFKLVKVSVASNQEEGVSPGNYRISVASAEVIDEKGGDIRRHIPMHYADFRTSELEMEISEPQENLVIELTWEGFEEVEDSEDDGDSDSEETVEVEQVEGESKRVESSEPEGSSASEEQALEAGMQDLKESE